VDTGEWAKALPMTDVVEVGPLQLYVLHDVAALDLDPTAAGFAAVIYGHSHRPGAEIRHGVLFLNPGSAGPRRFALPIAIAKLRLVGDQLSYEMIELRA
jgi:predicted phosphodiesterase